MRNKRTRSSLLSEVSRARGLPPGKLSTKVSVDGTCELAAKGASYTSHRGGTYLAEGTMVTKVVMQERNVWEIASCGCW